MPLQDKDFKNIKSEFEKFKKILIISHRNPDADTIGASFALNQILSENFNKKVTSACADKLPPNLNFLKGNIEILQKIDLKNYDVIVSVDCSSKEQMKYPETTKSFKDYKIPIINIDHHISNSAYGTINLIDPESASTTEILFRYFEYLKIPVKPYVATNLLAGIYCDTGSFMHSNTNSNNYIIAQKLLSAGASHSNIIKYMFKTKTVEQLQLWGKVFSNSRINKQKAIVSKVTEDDFIKTGTNPRDLAGIVNYLNSVDECKMSILLSEDMKGNVKGSVRSGNGNIDVAELCKQLGGGGHKKAAGFKLPGKIISKEVWSIESDIE